MRPQDQFDAPAGPGRVSRFYKVLVVGAASTLGACAGSADSRRIEPDRPDASDRAADDGGATDGAEASCCPAACASQPCSCQGEEIPCCWLVTHPLCENLCEE